MSSDAPAPTAVDGLTDALKECSLLLNGAQYRRLRSLAELKGGPHICSETSALPPNCRLALVIDPPTGLQIEHCLSSLAEDAVVVIPHGEDPAYDRVKSQLVAFGTVGADGASGPHQMWWGGRRRLAYCPPNLGVGPAAAAATMAPRAQLTDSLIASPPIVPDLQSDNAAVAEYILSNWETSDKPVIWADGRAGPPCVPDEFTHIDCDFAVFRRHRWRFEADLLYFGRRSPAEALLRTWVAFCRSFPAIDGTTLLDQAWCLVTSQACLDTLWLARSGNPGLPRRFSPVEDQEDRADGQICSAGLSADQFFKGRLKVARAAERTGFPEVLLSAPAAPGTDRRAIAIIRDVTSQDSRALGAMIEALATTFVAEPGGFRQLEIAICARREELYAALQSAPVDRALVVTPNHTVAPDTFRRLAEANNGMVIAAPSAIIVDMASYRSHRSSDILESVGST